MLTTAIGLAMLGQVSTARAILDEASSRLQRAKSLSMTVVETAEEFPRPSRTECAYRMGGYLRLSNGRSVQVANSESAWDYSTQQKTYGALPTLPRDMKAAQALWWLKVFVSELPVVGGAARVTWHGLKTLQIELDGRNAMTRETKLFVYFDPTTHLPLGVSANLGSITQVKIFERLTLDPKLPDSLFAFTPPSSWKRRTP